MGAASLEELKHPLSRKGRSLMTKAQDEISAGKTKEGLENPGKLGRRPCCLRSSSENYVLPPTGRCRSSLGDESFQCQGRTGSFAGKYHGHPYGFSLPAGAHLRSQNVPRSLKLYLCLSGTKRKRYRRSRNASRRRASPDVFDAAAI